MTRLLDDYGPHLARLAGEALVDAVTASEGRVLLAEVMAAAPPLLRGTANAELAAALGADLVCCNMFDPLDRDAVAPGLEGLEPAASGLTGLSRFMGLADLQRRERLPRPTVWKWTVMLAVPVIGPLLYHRRGRPALDARQRTAP